MQKVSRWRARGCLRGKHDGIQLEFGNKVYPIPMSTADTRGEVPGAELMKKKPGD